MSASVLFISFPLFALLVIAAAIDLRSRRIPNWLTVSLALCGLLQACLPHHIVSISQSLLGLAAGFGLTFILFALRALGGGDVKLLAAVGAWLGPGPVLAVFAIAAIAGMFIVVGQAVWHKRFSALVHNSAVVAINLIHVNEVGLKHAMETGRSSRTVDKPLPYAVPVLLGVALVFARAIYSGGVGA